MDDELKKMERAHIDMLHFDVMDGVFVPNISFGLPVLQSIAKATDLFLDVHLMITNPLRYIGDFARAGADMITFHLESQSDPMDTIAAIHRCGCQAGISIKPNTPCEALLPFLAYVDMILLMTVEPGFGGQGYLHPVTEKVATVRSWIDKQTRDILLEVDGGINDETAHLAGRAGANVLVAGSWLFKQTDMAQAAELLRQRSSQ